VIDVQLQAVATLTTRITPTSSLQFANQTPASLSATTQAVATLSLLMRQWNGVVPYHQHNIADVIGLRTELDAIEACLGQGGVSGPAIYSFAASHG
jgi:hypothetical protein